MLYCEESIQAESAATGTYQQGNNRARRFAQERAWKKAGEV